MNDTAVIVWSVVIWVVALATSVLGGAVVTPWVLRTAARTGNGPGGAGPTGIPAVPPPPAGAPVPLPPVPPPPGTPSGPDPAPRGGPTGTDALHALRGGTWIGLLERLGITGCLLAGYPEGIAFVVAVKGLGRYPELREHPVASERFVIGTLASMCWSAALGLAGAAILAGL